ncbi:putative RING-H2 finger protein ATL21A [Morella rubra]|uniref:RING-type E3 ubiquitin transferase n=1 Tax=Morella rubra TaxID=262757 RepID=A0A6A1UXH8_9ROSI|nr:putative RING-H2 finger protein ATL21A [Morella rubra]
MGILYFFFLVFITTCQGEGLSSVSPCGRHGPAIRFPFGVKDTQPEHSGFPGFDLSCTDTKDLVLELPNSVKLYVKKIDYKAQVIHLYDPHHHSLPCQLLRLDLSSSPFKFKEEYYHEEFTLFNCSQTEVYGQISCPSGASGFQVCAFESSTPIFRNDVELNRKWLEGAGGFWNNWKWTLSCKTVFQLSGLALGQPGEFLQPSYTPSRKDAQQIEGLTSSSTSTIADQSCWSKKLVLGTVLREAYLGRLYGNLKCYRREILQANWLLLVDLDN